MKCLLTALTLFLPSVLHAQSNCGPYAVMTGGLATKYQERLQMRGLNSNGQMLEIWASEAGAWTAVLVSPQGIACFVNAGQAFDVMKAEPAGVEG